MQRRCDTCGRPYEAQRASSRFCGDRCRSRNNGAPPKPAPPVELPTRVDDPDLVRVTREYLAGAGRQDKPLGVAALVLAERIAGGHEPGSAVASLTRVFSETLALAMQGAGAAADPMDQLRAQRDAKRAG